MILGSLRSGSRDRRARGKQVAETVDRLAARSLYVHTD